MLRRDRYFKKKGESVKIIIKLYLLSKWLKNFSLGLGSEYNTLFKGERLNELCVCHADGVKQVHCMLTF